MKRARMAVVLCLSFAAAAVLTSSPPAEAGVLDKLKSKAQELKKAAPSAIGRRAAEKGQSDDAQDGGAQAGAAQNGEDPDHPLRLTGQGHCKGRNSATCLDYMEVVDQCMDPVHGYRASLMAQRIEKRLNEDSTLDAERRKNLEEDLAAFRELAAKKSDDEPTLGGAPRSQRYLSDITDEDQVWVNAENIRFNNKIRNKCQGADHMGVGHRTELMTDFGPTGDEAVAKYRETHAARAASNDRRTAAMKSCMEYVTGLRYKVMADMMEKKMQTLTLSAKERAEWDADVAAVRKAAAAGGAAMPTVNDPVNPYRPLTRLAPQEQLELNNAYLNASKTAMADCQKVAAN